MGLITSGRRLMAFYILLSVLLLTGSLCKGDLEPEGPEGEGSDGEGPGEEGSDGEGPGGDGKEGEGPGEDGSEGDGPSSEGKEGAGPDGEAPEEDGPGGDGHGGEGPGEEGQDGKGSGGPGEEAPEGEGPGGDGQGDEGHSVSDDDSFNMLDGVGPNGEAIGWGNATMPMPHHEIQTIEKTISFDPGTKAIEEKIHNLNAYFARINEQYIAWSESQAVKADNRRRMRRMRRHRRH